METFFPSGMFPEGHFPEGHFPGESDAVDDGRAHYSINVVRILLKDPDETLLLTFEWDDVLTDGVTLASATHTVASPLVGTNEATDTIAGESQVDISGGVHAALYVIRIVGTLSNGQTVARNIPLRAYNS